MTYDLFVKPREVSIMRICHEDKCAREQMMLPYGGKAKVEQVHERYGGGGHNTAVGLTRLGFNATPIGTISDDAYGQRIIDNLEREHISPQYAQYSNTQKTGFSVIISSFEGERTVLYHPGANAECTQLKHEWLDDCEGFFFNHISARGQDADTIFHTIKQHFLKYPEKFLAWNPGKEQLSQGALAFADFFPVVDILLLNKEEAELFTARTAGKHSKFGQNISDCSEIFRVFARQGVRNVVITDGRNGAQLSNGTEIHYCPIHQDSPRIDTLGAGDAFGSGLFYALFHEKQLSSALKYATMNAASVVSQFGAQPGLLTQEELEKEAQATQLPHQKITL